jgi:hypothetical protein
LCTMSTEFGHNLIEPLLCSHGATMENLLLPKVY